MRNARPLFRFRDVGYGFCEFPLHTQCLREHRIDVCNCCCSVAIELIAELGNRLVHVARVPPSRLEVCPDGIWQDCAESKSCGAVAADRECWQRLYVQCSERGLRRQNDCSEFTRVLADMRVIAAPAAVATLPSAPNTRVKNSPIGLSTNAFRDSFRLFLQCTEQSKQHLSCMQPTASPRVQCVRHKARRSR
jgi:hypothetical protein